MNLLRFTLAIFLSSFSIQCMEERENPSFIFEKPAEKATNTKQKTEQADREKLQAIVGNTRLKYRGGYYFIKSEKLQKKGQRLSALKELDEKIAKEETQKSKKPLQKSRKQLFNTLVKNYKIHLMPQTKDQLFEIIQQLMRAIASNKKLQDNIAQIKVIFPLDFYDASSRQELEKGLEGGKGRRVVGIIVIYPALSKKAAQYVLNELYKLFGDLQGLNIPPNFNEQVTSLIYFAQGDGDFKGDEYAHYYESGQVYYKHPTNNNAYHLRNPAQKTKR